MRSVDAAGAAASQVRVAVISSLRLRILCEAHEGREQKAEMLPAGSHLRVPPSFPRPVDLIWRARCPLLPSALCLLTVYQNADLEASASPPSTPLDLQSTDAFGN